MPPGRRICVAASTIVAGRHGFGAVRSHTADQLPLAMSRKTARLNTEDGAANEQRDGCGDDASRAKSARREPAKVSPDGTTASRSNNTVSLSIDALRCQAQFGLQETRSTGAHLQEALWVSTSGSVPS